MSSDDEGNAKEVMVDNKMKENETLTKDESDAESNGDGEKSKSIGNGDKIIENEDKDSSVERPKLKKVNRDNYRKRSTDRKYEDGDKKRSKKHDRRRHSRSRSRSPRRRRYSRSPRRRRENKSREDRRRRSRSRHRSPRKSRRRDSERSHKKHKSRSRSPKSDLNSEGEKNFKKRSKSKSVEKNEASKEEEVKEGSPQDKNEKQRSRSRSQKKSSSAREKRSTSRSKKRRSRSRSQKRRSRSRSRKRRSSSRRRHRRSRSRSRKRRSRSRKRSSRRKSRSTSRRKRSARRSSSSSPYRFGFDKAMDAQERLARRLERAKELTRQKKEEEAKIIAEKGFLHLQGEELRVAIEQAAKMIVNSAQPVVSQSSNTSEHASAQMKALKQQAKAETGITVPSYYNPMVVNPLQYAQQEAKRKKLWSKKEDSEEKAEETEGAKASGTVWGKMSLGSNESDEKFAKLMGIKQTDQKREVDENDEVVKKQQELMSNLDIQYQQARVVTHTQRGMGLGFSAGVLNPNAAAAQQANQQLGANTNMSPPP